MKQINRRFKSVLAIFISIVLLCSITSVICVGVTSVKNIASSSVVKSECPGWASASLGPEKLIDNNKDSFSTTSYSTNQYNTKEIYLIFDKAYTVEEIKLYPRILNSSSCAFPVNFTVSLYNGQNWIVVKDASDVSVSSAFEIDTAATEATALRITATKLGEADNGEYALQLAEIEVFADEVISTLNAPETALNATNIATSATIKAECPGWAMASLQPEKMIDTNINSFSTSTYVKAEKTERDITLLFDKAYKISGITLFPRVSGGEYVGGFPKDFSISVWGGERWEEVYDVSDYSSDKNELFVPLDLNDVVAVKISAYALSKVEGGNEYALQLAEINVFGVPSGSDIKYPIILDGATNIATSSSVVAECPHWAEESLSPEKLIDNNIESNFYTSSYTDDCNAEKEIYFTFDNAYKINSVDLYPRLESNEYKGGFPKNFTISAWTAEGWKEVSSVTDYNSDNRRLTVYFEPIDCRGIKIKVEKLDLIKGEDKYALQLAEVKINGISSSAVIDTPVVTIINNDIAKLSEISAHSPDWAVKAGYTAEKLTNGIKTYGDFYTSEYLPNSKANKNIYFSFDKAYKLTKLVLYPRLDKDSKYAGGFPKDFTISVWDGSQWFDVAGKTGYSSGAEALIFELNTVSCSGLRIMTSKLSAVDGGEEFALQFAEIEISGSSSNDNISKPEIISLQNVALGAEIIAESPQWAIKAGYNAEKLNDDIIGKGNPGNFYTSTYEKSDTVKKEVNILLDTTYSVEKLILYPRIDKNGNIVGGFPKSITVQVWNGVEWKDVAQSSELVADATGVELELNKIDCRAVRVVATILGQSENADEYCLQFSEIQIIGSSSKLNIAKPTIDSPDSDENEGGYNQDDAVTPDKENEGGVALYSDVEAECPSWALKNLGPEKLVDGNLTNFYTSTYVSSPKTGKTVCITFEKTAVVNQINIYPRIKDNKYVGGFPENFKVSVWNGKEWIKVAEETGYKSDNKPYKISVKNLTVNGILIEASRLSLTDDYSQFALQIAEVEAIGKKVDKILSKPKVITEESKRIVIDNTKNIALNCPTKATSDLAKYSGGVANINDGSEGTFWASNTDEYTKGKTESVTINLLDNYMIDTVVLAARNKAWGFPYDFKISVFYNDKWTDVLTVKNFEADETAGVLMYEFKFALTLGNKIRISSDNFRKSGADNSMCINEMAVYGTRAKGNYILPNENVISTAVSVTATSSMEDYGFYLNQLYDNDLLTEWSSKPYARANEKQVIEVDLKKDILLSEIQLKPSWGGNGFPLDFTISVLENGKWVDVYTAKDYEKPIDEAIKRFAFEQKRVSKFKITVDKMRQEGGVYVVKLNEILAFPYATDDSYDLNAVTEVKSEKKYTPTEVISDDITKNNWFSNNLTKLIIGIVCLMLAAAGSVLLIKKTSIK